MQFALVHYKDKDVAVPMIGSKTRARTRPGPQALDFLSLPGSEPHVAAERSAIKLHLFLLRQIRD